MQELLKKEGGSEKMVAAPSAQNENNGLHHDNAGSVADHPDNCLVAHHHDTKVLPF